MHGRLVCVHAHRVRVLTSVRGRLVCVRARRVHVLTSVRAWTSRVRACASCACSHERACMDISCACVHIVCVFSRACVHGRLASMPPIRRTSAFDLWSISGRYINKVFLNNYRNQYTHTYV